MNGVVVLLGLALLIALGLLFWAFVAWREARRELRLAREDEAIAERLRQARLEAKRAES